MDKIHISHIQNQIQKAGATLLVVSKTRQIEQIQFLYDMGFRDMGENRVQSLMERIEALPNDINWHVIGHLQKNKVKYIAEFVSLIHSVDSLELLQTIDKEAKKHDRIIPVLFQCKVAEEDSKFGIAVEDVDQFVDDFYDLKLENVVVHGIMGMGTLTENSEKTRSEFRELKEVFDGLKAKYFSDQKSFKELSMGMSGDYEIALEEGSTMVRLGSVLFG